MSNLITLDYFKSLPLGIKTSTLEKLSDTALNNFIATASEQVRKYCDRQFDVTTITNEPHYTKTMRRLVLEQYPVISLTSISWTDDTGQTGTHDPSDFRILPGGIIEWKLTRFPAPFLQGRIYYITYSAGYATIPGPVQHATALWVTELLQPAYAGPSNDAPELVTLTSQQIGELLESYRRRRIG
jgi:hypothetical protein